MNLKTIATLSLIILNAGSNSFALPSNGDCSRDFLKFLQKAQSEATEVLARNPEAVQIQGELFKAGRFLNDTQALANLPDGAYIYVIYRDGTVGFTNRMPDLADRVEPLASHRSIDNMLTEIRGHESEVVAAGEFERHQGRTSLINNKSSTWKGGEKQLLLAKKKLNEHGLEIDDAIISNDYSTRKIADKHNAELIGIKDYQDLYFNPQTKPLLDRLDAINKKIYAAYPSSVPGLPDLGAFLKSTHRKVSISTHLDMDFMTEIEGQSIAEMLSKSTDYTERAHIIKKLIHAHGFEKTKQLLDEALDLEGAFTR